VIGPTMWLLCALVFLNQGGVPIPVVPALLVAGASAGHDSASLVMTAVGGTAAALAADLVWYGVGRWRSRQARALVCRMSIRTAARLEHAERRFRAHRFAFLMGARFLSALNPIAAGVAGATGMTLWRFVMTATTTGVVWTAVWVSTGYFIGPVAIGIPSLTLVATLGLGVIAVGAVTTSRLRRHAVAAGPKRPCDETEPARS
jgi:membrane protein DedA with SNARE-associated domain